MPRSRNSDSRRNATSSGAGGHLYGIPAMPMTTPAAIEPVQRRAESLGPLGRIEMVGFGVEVLDRLRHDPRPCRQDELVVTQWESIGQGDDPLRLVDALDLADDQSDPLVQKPAFWSVEVRGMLAAHCDVHKNPGW